MMDFMMLPNMLASAFSLGGGIVAAYELLSVAKLLAKRKGKTQEDQGRECERESELLARLKKTESPTEKADIFVALLQTGHILSHKIVNGGGKYDDTEQQARFQRFLTPLAIKKINRMDGTIL